MEKDEKVVDHNLVEIQLVHKTTGNENNSSEKTTTNSTAIKMS